MSPEELRDVRRSEAISQELSRRTERAQASESRPVLELDGSRALQVDLQGAMAEKRRVLSMQVEDRGRLRRRSFEVTKY